MRRLPTAAVLMVTTGLGFATFSALWPLMIVAFFGPLNPGGGDVSVFYPLEHTALAAAAPARSPDAMARRQGLWFYHAAVG